MAAAVAEIVQECPIAIAYQHPPRSTPPTIQPGLRSTPNPNEPLDPGTLTRGLDLIQVSASAIRGDFWVVSMQTYA